MGQYYKVVNLDKKEFLMPHTFDDGAKLMEFGGSGGGTMLGLAILLANSNGRGGGDCRSKSPIIGSWAGDRIVIAGDYAEGGDKGEAEYAGKKRTDGREPDPNLYSLCAEGEYKDISDEVIKALKEDGIL